MIVALPGLFSYLFFFLYELVKMLLFFSSYFSYENDRSFSMTLKHLLCYKLNFLLTVSRRVFLLQLLFVYSFPVSILYKSIAGRYRHVRVADGPITALYRFIKNASWVMFWTSY